jgi:hypothetical protein
VEDAATANSTEVIPLRNRGRPLGKGRHAAASKNEKEDGTPAVKQGQLDKAAFKEWKLQLGKRKVSMTRTIFFLCFFFI